VRSAGIRKGDFGLASNLEYSNRTTAATGCDMHLLELHYIVRRVNGRWKEKESSRRYLETYNVSSAELAPER
jgi:hypothetical protein